MKVEWKRVTNELPEEGRDYLVWTGHFMIVSEPSFYNIEELANHYPAELVENLQAAKGYFQEFGQKYYFDDASVYYAELPEPPEKE